jgi:hypothetical protein
VALTWLAATPEFAVAASSSPLSFDHDGSEDWPSWWRYLAIDGQRIFRLGNICETCGFFFDRLNDPATTIAGCAVAEGLRTGIASLDDGAVRRTVPLLPVGRYRGILLDTSLTLVEPGGPGDYFVEDQRALWNEVAESEPPHDPRTAYYRGRSPRLGPVRQLFEFVVPLVPPDRLDQDTVAAYERRRRQDEHPTALAISVFEVTGPAFWHGDPQITEHWCLAHYLLDGNHKALAAARVGKPLRILSFLALDESLARADQIELLLAAPDGIA